MVVETRAKALGQAGIRRNQDDGDHVNSRYVHRPLRRWPTRPFRVPHVLEDPNNQPASVLAYIRLKRERFGKTL